MENKLFGKLFRTARKNKDMTQEVIAGKIGVSRQSVQKWESGDSFPEIDKWPAIQEALDVEPSWVSHHIEETLKLRNRKNPHLSAVASILERVTSHSRGNSGLFAPEPSGVSPAFSTSPAIEVPLISWVQAGNWQEIEDLFQPGYSPERYPTNKTKSGYAFALKVHGDSMEPRFLDGDVIIVDPERPPENGSYVIAKNGDEATFKQLVKDGENVFLKPLNNRYPIRDMTGIDFKIVGVVVQRITDI